MTELRILSSSSSPSILSNIGRAAFYAGEEAAL
jgi:hypothetical protein